MTDILEHIFLDIPSVDLKAHFVERVVFHTQKAEDYRSKAETLRGLDLNAGVPVSNDPTQQLEQSIRTHMQRAQTFAFRAKYLVADVIFRLNDSDLANLEFVDRFGF